MNEDIKYVDDVIRLQKMQESLSAAFDVAQRRLRFTEAAQIASGYADVTESIHRMTADPRWKFSARRPD